MNCQEVNEHWDAFLAEDCPDELEEKIKEHLDGCESCSGKLEDTLNEQTPAVERANGAKQLHLGIKRQQRILKRARWKQRLSTAMSLIGILILLTMVGSIFSGLFYTVGEKSKVEHAGQVLETLTEMTAPNMSLNGISSNGTPYLTMKLETQITKQLGADYQRPLGTLKANLFFPYLFVDRTWDRSSGLDVTMHFLNPDYKGPHDQTGEMEEDYWMDANWGHLEKVKNGTVAEVAITLDKNYSIKDAQKLLVAKDVETIWMAIDTGHIYDEPERTTPYASQMEGLWGLPVNPHSDVLTGLWKNGPDSHERTVEKGWFGLKKFVSETSVYEFRPPEAQTFLDGIQFLQKNKRYAKGYPYHPGLGGVEKELERVETYVNENGVEVYGIVITGPTEEILKLKDNEHIKYMSVGEIDWWNYGGNNFSGTLHN